MEFVSLIDFDFENQVEIARHINSFDVLYVYSFE